MKAFLLVDHMPKSRKLSVNKCKRVVITAFSIVIEYYFFADIKPRLIYIWLNTR